jgi:hypothetical protein
MALAQVLVDPPADQVTVSRPTGSLGIAFGLAVAGVLEFVHSDALGGAVLLVAAVLVASWGIAVFWLDIWLCMGPACTAEMWRGHLGARPDWFWVARRYLGVSSGLGNSASTSRSECLT